MHARCFFCVKLLNFFCKIAKKGSEDFIWDKIKNSCLELGVFEILSTEKILIIFAQIVFSYWLHEYQLIINQFCASDFS